MTFKSRRKRPIILLLALTATTALSLPIFGGDDETNGESRHARRQKINERIKNTPTLRVSGSTEQPPTATPPIDPEQTRLEINIEPPNREQLFKLQTASLIIDIKQAELAKDSKGDVLPTPGPFDRFNVPNNERLGRLWFESVVIDRGFGKAAPGTMGVVNQAGRYPYKDGVKPPTSAAVMNEYLPTTDVSVAVDVNLAAPGNEFGVILRAKSSEIEIPATAKDGDQYFLINAGEFYSVTATTDKVEFRRVQKGKATVVKSQALPPKTIFRLTVRAVGPTFRVYRDAEEVMSVDDATFTGHYCGVIGVRADAGPVNFDDYEAKSYAGEFMPRMWAASTRLYRGANVHYNTLYFEQSGLERHGHHLGNPFHPFIAHSLFFVDVALLPMSLGRSDPWECYASDLYARPGDLVPFYINCPEMTAKSLLYEAAVLAPIFILAP